MFVWEDDFLQLRDMNHHDDRRVEYHMNNKQWWERSRRITIGLPSWSRGLASATVMIKSNWYAREAAVPCRWETTTAGGGGNEARPPLDEVNRPADWIENDLQRQIDRILMTEDVNSTIAMRLRLIRERRHCRPEVVVPILPTLNFVVKHRVNGPPLVHHHSTAIEQLVKERGVHRFLHRADVAMIAAIVFGMTINQGWAAERPRKNVFSGGAANLKQNGSEALIINVSLYLRIQKWNQLEDPAEEIVIQEAVNGCLHYLLLLPWHRSMSKSLTFLKKSHF